MLYRISLGFFFVLLFTWSNDANAQGKSIKLKNPSFNGTPQIGARILNWYNCGSPTETPPDIQPNLDPFGTSFFGVTQKAYKDSTYLGMVVRDNDTYEAVGQRLRYPLEVGKCYEFNMHLSRSKIYFRSHDGDDVIAINPDKKPGNMDQPVIVRIWGGSGYCGKNELLAESDLIKNTIWKKYKFRFEPKEKIGFIMIEAYFKIPTVFAYNGNVLIDNLSDIVPVPCGDEPEQPIEPEEALASIDKVPIPDKKINQKPEPEEPSTPEVKEYDYVESKPKVESSKPKKKKEKTLQGLERSELRRGQTIKIDRLYFEVDDSTINSVSYAALDELYDFMQVHKGVTFEIRGHTDGSCDDVFCDKLSLARAKAVVQYLVRKGVSNRRLKYEGYGKRRPIASNKYASGRKKNRRVEVKILSLDG